MVLEPLEWAGNLNKSIDESQLGEYLFEVRERGSGKLLYSRGFNSVFGEWKTTEEALHGNRTFSESLRFPSPEGSVEVSLKDGKPQVHRVTAGVHCNMAINPRTIEAQIQGGVVFGISTTLPGNEITLKNGVVQQSNFSDYTPAYMASCPQVDVHVTPQLTE